MWNLEEVSRSEVMIGIGQYPLDYYPSRSTLLFGVLTFFKVLVPCELGAVEDEEDCAR